ncbi:magnesium transporter MRS2-2-like isoform X2 [Lotus japonicus]|uniref:magnesium transporter MRS2-2-like isoform X2 n=1 Tax=Lotus japonicus TaxID=34305 RepID=UPI00258D7002|nr:magnesium transporter MRS2-2-like isoform X2 [Lotus japonicus]
MDLADSASLELQAPSAVTKKTAVFRSWILLNHDGVATLLDVDKYAIMRLVEIHARDLRILDPLLSYPSTILGRDKVIVLNLEHIKAIITAEEVLLRDPMDDDLMPVIEELRRRLPIATAAGQGQGEEDTVAQDGESGEEDEFPFEFRALEVVLEAICSFLDARTRELESAAYPALDELTSKISCRNLDKVRKLKGAMTRLTNRVQKIRDELENLLDDDDDMAELYLSRKFAASSSPTSSSCDPKWLHSSPNPDSEIHNISNKTSTTTVEGDNDVEELEMLLEAYFMQIDGTLNKLKTV